MNREIKFRVWDKKGKGMSYSDDVYKFRLEFIDNKLAIEIYYSQYSGLKRVKDFKLMQYTGLKDKNGKEIYEGDICRNGDWDENANAYVYRIEEVTYKAPSFEGWNYNDNAMICEVIGNIYESKYLLNGKEN